MRLSVVIAAFNSGESVRACLTSLMPQLTPDDEAIVSTNLPPEEIAPLELLFPDVSWLRLDSSTNVPSLRARGAAVARGGIIGFTEDHFVFGPAWARAIAESFEKGSRAVCGAIEILEPAAALDRAMYFFDYGRYMRPLGAGGIESFSGANAAFHRELLTSDLLDEGLYEVVIGGHLRARGVMLEPSSDAVVFHAGKFGMARARFVMRNAGRNYAALRLAGRNVVTRLAYALSTPLLMIIFPVRTSLLIWRKGRHRAEWLACLPHFLLISASWTSGELLGAIAGGGDSAARWK